MSGLLKTLRSSASVMSSSRSSTLMWQSARSLPSSISPSTRSFAKQKKGGKKAAVVDDDDDMRRGQKSLPPKLVKLMEEFVTPSEGNDPRTPQQKVFDKYVEKMYSKQQLKETRYLEKAFSARLRVKWAAINALPPTLRAAALIEEDGLLPMFPLPTNTPPIPGYEEQFRET